MIGHVISGLLRGLLGNTRGTAASKETGMDYASIHRHLDKKLVKKQPRFINY